MEDGASAISSSLSAESGDQLLEGRNLIAGDRVRDEDRRFDAGGAPFFDAIAHFGGRAEEGVVGEPAVGQEFGDVVAAVVGDGPLAGRPLLGIAGLPPAGASIWQPSAKDQAGAHDAPWPG